ncbi:hypothetical protein SAMN05443429_10655 [Cruoricaptor ignavus]|uniref:Uncharacterized protein n=1 Tax=Cruoricaptor ignavus TaxID=1118202 RepID=A0A1M6F054_9FLAO|nr:hypothetical protein [Cruoricaptor ignavus]QOR73680.1 hypothetical protein IMZ16_09225 [Cruoricaptor ignavus]SHI91035.1 hypothetical protein SAMN05443429_10655 [Cruoricaptor ignavus]
MKYILELILSTAIVFFVWNWLQGFFPQRRFSRKPKEENFPKGTSGKIKWDAETAEYEEIPNEPNNTK